MNDTIKLLREQISSLRIQGQVVTAIDEVDGIYIIRKLNKRGWSVNDFINPRYIKQVISGSNYIKIESELPLFGTVIRTFTF